MSCSMTPAETSEAVLQEKHEAAIMKLVSDVRCGKLDGSEKLALATVDLLESVISDSENASALELLRLVRSVGGRLVRALPRVVEPSCLTRRLLKAIRDEHNSHHAQSSESGANAGESLQRLVLGVGLGLGRRGTVGAGGAGLTDPLREHVTELRLELESSSSLILSEWSSLTMGDQLILAMGGGGLLRRAMAHAKGARLVVVEGADVEQCHSMAARLCAAGADVTVTSLAATAALMSRVNKVVIEASAVLGGGAVLAPRGTRAVTAAARLYSVPVVCLSPLHRLCPLHSCALEHLTAPTAPTQRMGVCTELSPGLDHIPPDHITLFITNLGGSSPSYMYRLLSELYDPRDYQL